MRDFGTAKERLLKEDTKEAVEVFARQGVELIVFVRGDGTARDVFEVIDADIPALGVATGVKMYSSVFAATPRNAAFVVRKFLDERTNLEVVEVLEINEESYRRGQLDVKVVGALLIPGLKVLYSTQTPLTFS